MQICTFDMNRTLSQLKGKNTPPPRRTYRTNLTKMHLCYSINTYLKLLILNYIIQFEYFKYLNFFGNLLFFFLFLMKIRINQNVRYLKNCKIYLEKLEENWN